MPPAPAGWPTALPVEAKYGLAGDTVNAIEPHTESDPAALLLQLLVAFGNVVGRNAYYQVEGTKHYPNLFAVIVGESGKSRKGTSWGQIKRLFQQLDPTWTSGRIINGLSSGEGLIWAVRDAGCQITPRTKNSGQSDNTETIDPGIQDKRLLALEPEFASVLKSIERQGNTLSPVIRNAWDDGNLNILTKNNAAKATNAHISIIGHITDQELRRNLTQTESANGFGNRFLWVCARRSKFLPDGGSIESVNLHPLLVRLKNAVNYSKSPMRITMDVQARKLWHTVYRPLSEGKPGLVGAVTGRAEAQVIRLACIYALLDCTNVISEAHLKAGLAVWRYIEQSCHAIFGNLSGDPIADEILSALRKSPRPLARTDIRDLFGRNVKYDRIQQALDSLHKSRLIQKRMDSSGSGRPTEYWRAVIDDRVSPTTITTETTKPTKSSSEPEGGVSTYVLL